jgi:hypothetical protein
LGFPKALPTVGRYPNRLRGKAFRTSRGDPRLAMYNRGPFDIATLAIFPEYIEFDGEEVLQLVVPGAAGRTIK